MEDGKSSGYLGEFSVSSVIPCFRSFPRVAQWTQPTKKDRLSLIVRPPLPGRQRDLTVLLGKVGNLGPSSLLGWWVGYKMSPQITERVWAV